MADRLVALGDGVVSYSDDALTWNGATPPHATNDVYAVIHDGTQFVAGGASVLSTSPDGQVWTDIFPGVNPFEAAIKSLIYVADFGLYLAGTGAGGGQILSSPDLVTWTERYDPGTQGIEDFAYSPSLGICCAASLSGQVITSTDGITWTARTLNGNDRRAVVWCESLGMFIAAGNSGDYWTSTNGTSWTHQGAIAAIAAGGDVYGLIWSEDLGVAVAFGGTAVITYSTNGTSWSTASSDPFVGVNLIEADGVWYEPGSLFVLGGADGKLATSPDGDVWTQQATLTGAVYAVTYGSASLRRGILVGSVAA